MKNILAIVLIVLAEVLGGYGVYLGIKKFISGNAGSGIGDIFKTLPISESSGYQLLMQGGALAILGIVLYYLWFM